MSCYHCYTKTARNDDLIDKIIEHGEHLKSSMIETILKNQPIAATTTATRSNEIYSNRKQLEQIQMYLRGDPMNKDDELQVLDTLRSISVIELNKITDQTYTNRSDNTTTYQQIKTINYLQYIDCMKITINSIKLNDIGNKKVCVDKLTNLTQTFFIEYRIPAILIRHTNKLKPKVDSGLDSSNIVRLCARRSCDQEIIIFKHSTIHDIVNNLNRLDLDEIQIKFKISYRNFRQKHPEILGYAIFPFNSFKNLCYNQDLTINCDDNQLINVGKLKFSIQLGCERLYFGKEVLEVINENLDNSNDNKNDDREEICNKINTPKVLSHNKIEINPNPVEISTRIDENSILFCLIYVQEARFDRHISNSFLNCRMFARELYFSSKLYESGSNPIYNFYQQVPLIYNEDLLMKLRDNYLIVEFLEKSANQKDFLVGLAKLSLHSFYLTFRNSVIVDYLKNKHLPVISTDGWETICNTFNDRIIGDASILLALGTKEQIDNLLNERGLKRNIVKCNLQDQSIQVDEVSKNYPLKPLKSIGTQSDMEHKDIGSLLNQLINAQKQRNVENSSTNTDVVDHQPQLQQPVQEQQQQQPELRRTSDLLDTLQKALSLDKDVENNCKKIEKKTFKCQILIDSALHLPSRKKCKSKKSKNQKSNKHNDDILPSTYVTFEITTNNIRITPIITKCTNPKWDYRCDVVLPIEYLTNKQKRLIFKVWRKSTNTTMTPNLQTDFIIGFATVDLTVLLAGLPTIQGWYNIVDFSNKCHGQINIHITPLENISRYQQQPVGPVQETSTNCNAITEPIEIQIDNESDNTDCNELLSRTLKRKFIELDEITQRLRLRLSKVTNDPDTDDTETLSNDDELIDEFEHDINTLCVEDDFDMVDFEKQAKHFNDNHLKEIGLLQQTLPNQPKIDNLVENLSINDTSATTTSRYISGCSNTGTMLDLLEQNSRPNLYTNESFSRAMVEKFTWPSDSNSSSSSSESINNGKQLN